MIEVELTPHSPKQITGVNIKVQEMNFNESATFRVELINGKSLVDIQFVEIKGENYGKWNGDDDYIIDFIIGHLGFLRKGERKIYREPISEEEYLELEDELTSFKTENNEFKIRLEDELLKGKILKKNMEEILIQNNMLTEKLSVITFEKNNLKFQFESVNTKYDEITRLSDDKKRHYEYLINRIDELVVFHSLDDKDIGAIARIQLQVLEDRLGKMDIGLMITDAALKKIAEAGFDPVYGARPLKRAIQQQIENPLSKAILQGDYGPKDVIAIDVNGSELSFKKFI